MPIASKAGISFVSAAQPFVEILHLEFKSIAGGDTLEIGRSAIFDPPKAGRYIVARAPRANYSGTKWSMSPDGREILADGQPLNTPAMVLRIAFSKSRNDWFRIPELSKAYAGLQDSVRNAKLDELDNRLSAFRVAALTCADLLPSHAKQLSDQVCDEFAGVRATLGPSKSMRGTLRSSVISRSADAVIQGPRALNSFNPFG